MKEPPIIFNGEMVRAYFGGRKTQTRRLKNLKLVNENPDDWTFVQIGYSNKIGGPKRTEVFSAVFVNDKTGEELWIKSLYGGPGDRLWVRENFGILHKGELDRAPLWDGLIDADVPKGASREDIEKAWIEDKMRTADGYELLYRAGCFYGHETLKGWRPSIHMPRWAARTLLDVVSVRVERVQDISEEDAKAEGVIFHDGMGTGHSGFRYDLNHEFVYSTAKKAFAQLWDSINLKRGFGWDTNPWVFVVEWPKYNA